MMITVAQGIVQALEQEGVEVAFGYPGAAICPLYDALSHSAIRHVLVRQEQNAAHAASGYARISGRPGVAIATSGPGAVNLLTGLATAYMDSIPLVALTGQVSCDQIGKDVFQEADITGAAEPFTKYSFLLKEPSKVAQALKEAFYIAASGRPGPVLVDLPIDVLQAHVEFHYPDAVNIRGYKPTYAGNPPQVRRVSDAIRDASRPLICIGGGVLSAGAGDALLALAEQCSLPMVSTMMGLSAVPSSHPLYYGMLGSYGSKTANWALTHADLLVIIGARVGDRALQSPGILEKRARIVHIDVDPAEIGKNIGASVPLVGDAKNVLQQLLGCMPKAEGLPWLQELDEKRRSFSGELDLSPRQGAVNPRSLLRTLSQKLDPNATIVADVGQNQIWSARCLSFQNGRFLTSGGMGTMGYSLPAAIGAKIASPDRQTVVICGDGALQMQMMELSTLCQEGLPIKILVMNNGTLGMVRELQDLHYSHNLTAVKLRGGPDFLRLADAFGIPHGRLDRDEDAARAIEEMLSSPGPYLLECLVDPQEPSL